MEVTNYKLNCSDISRPLPFLANRGLWYRVTWSASGDDGRNQMAVHRGPATLRPGFSRGGSPVAATPIYHALLYIKGKAIPLQAWTDP
jgi:hypothetical protein